MNPTATPPELEMAALSDRSTTATLLEFITGVNYRWKQGYFLNPARTDISFVCICLWYFRMNLASSISVKINNLVANNQQEYATRTNNLEDYRNRQYHTHKWLNNTFSHDPKNVKQINTKMYTQIDVPKNDFREVL